MLGLKRKTRNMSGGIKEVEIDYLKNEIVKRDKTISQMQDKIYRLSNDMTNIVSDLLKQISDYKQTIIDLKHELIEK